MIFDETQMLHHDDEHADELDMVRGHGCHYYTRQPAPTQWIAVGITSESSATIEVNRRLLVGTGRSETAAVRSLRRRCQWTAGA